jgi:hypothetical protein
MPGGGRSGLVPGADGPGEALEQFDVGDRIALLVRQVGRNEEAGRTVRQFGDQSRQEAGQVVLVVAEPVVFTASP